MTRRFPTIGCAVLAALLAAACDSQSQSEEQFAGEWPQFRGPEGLAVSPQEGLPTFWRADSPAIRWRARVAGSGNSSPVVSGGRIFLTSVYTAGEAGAAEKDQRFRRMVLAYDLETGEQLWETEVFEGPAGKRHHANTHAAPTAVTDGKHVFVTFDAHIAALDFDGEVLWHREVDPDYYEETLYGVSSSPVLAGDVLVLLQDKEQGEHEYPGWIAAFDKRTGEQVWRDEWSHTCCSYNTPLVVPRDGRLEVWNQTALEVVGYDAQTGERVWQGEHYTMQTVPSMVRQGDLLATPGGIHHRSLVMFHLCPSGEVSPIPIWSTITGSPEVASPVLYRDRLYTVSQGGALYVFDVRSGEMVWKQRLPSGTYRSSLVAGDGKVYVPNSYGVTTVIDAESEKPRILSRNDLGDGSNATPAIAGGTILLRGQNHLYRIGKGARGAEPEPEPEAAAAEPGDGAPAT